MKKILLVLTIFASMFVSRTLKAEETDNAAIFQKSLQNLSKYTQDFEEELKSTPLDTIVTEPDSPIAGMTYEDFFVSRQPYGYAYYSPEQMEAFNMNYVGFAKKVRKKFDKYFGDLYPVLNQIAIETKDLPVRLGSISIEFAPFGIGGQAIININYDSPVYNESNDDGTP